jgi:hypothetical protein
VSTEEVIVPFDPPRSQAPLATGVRSTVLLGSLRGLRTRNLYSRYLTHLAPRSNEAIVSITANQWLPISVAIDHYAACEKLGVQASVAREIGEESGVLLSQTALGAILKMSTNAGMTPWPAIGQSRRLIERTWQGTSIAAFKLGPKEARLEWVGHPCAPIPYFRVAFGGFLNGLLGLFCRKSYVNEIPKLCTPTAVAYQASWV